MRNIALVAAAAVIAFAGSANAKDAKLLEDARSLFKPIPLVATVKDNVITREKIELGKALFFDPRLSSSGLLSCNTCHNVGMGGDDNLVTSVGHGWQAGPRNSPTVFNAVFNSAQFWDGRADTLKEQAKGPVQASVEMNNTPDMVEKTLRSIPQYVADFKRAFPGEKEPVTFDNMANAIEAFEATLITPNAKFDQFLEGNLAAMNAQEKEGLRLFMDKGCSTCHAGVNVGGESYFPFGLVEKPGSEILPADDKGRFAVTNTADDNYVFRAGPLRNIALTAPYFHSGKVWSLKQAVAIMGSSQLGIDLKDKEVDSIVAFLNALTGEQPRIEYPILPVSTDSTPLPKPMN